MGTLATVTGKYHKGNTTTTIEKRYRMKWEFGCATVDCSLEYVKSRFKKETGRVPDCVQFGGLTYGFKKGSLYLK